MLIGDRNALMVSVRVTGYGTRYNADVTCPACGARNSASFNLSELEIKRLQLSPVAKGQNLFEFTLPVTNKKVHFKFLTGKDEEERSIVAERKKKMMPDSVIETNVTARLEQVIVSIDGIDDRNKINTFIKNMPAQDSRKLRKYIVENEPGIDMNAWMQCSSCSESSKVPLPMGINFFWPSE
jgi:hypothetical protein